VVTKMKKDKRKCSNFMPPFNAVPVPGIGNTQK
jgi:hypothetical protein